MKTLKTLGFLTVITFFLAACQPDPEFNRVFSGPSKVVSGATYEIFKITPPQNGATHLEIVTFNDPSKLTSLSTSQLERTVERLVDEAQSYASAQCAREGTSLRNFQYVDAVQNSIGFAVACG